MISVASMKKVTSAAAKVAVKHDWVAAAMTDDQMVAELLIRLKHAGTVVSENPGANLPPLQWGIRQRRSRSSRFGGRGVLVSLKKDVDSVRASPKTPLSWSGGSGSGGGGGSASPSTATADGFEDISRQASCSTSTGSGSKVPYLSLISLSLSLSQNLSFLNSCVSIQSSLHLPSFRLRIRQPWRDAKIRHLVGFSVPIWISPTVARS